MNDSPALPVKRRYDVWPFEVKIECKAQFFRDVPLQKISLNTGVPFNTLEKWRKSEHWVRERDAMKKRATKAVVKKVEQKYSKEQLRFIKANTSVSGEITEHVRKHTRDTRSIDPSDLQKLSGAAAKAHAIGSKTLGLERRDDDKKGVTKINNLIIVQSAEQLKQAKAIDVESHEITE